MLSRTAMPELVLIHKLSLVSFKVAFADIWLGDSIIIVEHFSGLYMAMPFLVPMAISE